MLKRITHIVLILLITVATSGFTIVRHCCGNQLDKVYVFQSPKCDCGSKDCHNVLKQIKVTDNFSTSEIVHSGAPTCIDMLPLAFIQKVHLSKLSLSSDNINIKAPPLIKGNLFALLQSFRC
jgi:hypothetical protein